MLSDASAQLRVKGISHWGLKTISRRRGANGGGRVGAPRKEVALRGCGPMKRCLRTSYRTKRLSEKRGQRKYKMLCTLYLVPYLFFPIILLSISEVHKDCSV